MTDVPQLPDSALAIDALEFASMLEHPAILAHSVRVFLLGRLIADQRGFRHGADFDPELFFVASVLHDIGTTERFSGPQRFEVEGADAASAFLTSHGFSGSDVDAVWEAIALHTSPGIAERRGPLTALVRAGVLTDFKTREEVSDDVVAAIEGAYPRAAIEKVLGSAVLTQCIATPSKAPASSWPGDLYRAHLADPAHRGVNPAF